jgi:hypothetical protein
MARGDRIRTECRVIGRQVVYQHHGIDLGDGTVVHARPFQFARLFHGGSVVRTSREEFAGSSAIELQTEPAAVFPPEEIADRAELLVGSQGYCPVFANCEHFVSWCATGRTESRQIEILADRLRGFGTRVAAAVSTQAATATVGRLAGGSLLRGSLRLGLRGVFPAAVIAEAAAAAAEWTAHQAGHSKRDSRRAAESAGLATSAAVFAVTVAAAGPVAMTAAAVAGVATWSGGSRASAVVGRLTAMQPATRTERTSQP